MEVEFWHIQNAKSMYVLLFETWQQNISDITTDIILL
jgi:hypothetical protein